MGWLHSLDVALFRFINGDLSHPALDPLMRFASGNAFFVPVVVLIALALIWKGGARGRVYVFFIVLAVALGDGWICKTIKDAIARPRPFLGLSEVNLLVGRGRNFAFPSSHAANWFAATMVTFIFYRRSWRFMLPLALLVSFSRIYVGSHYPSDVLGGAILGAGYAAAFIWLAHALWQWIGKKFFPLWWQKLPSLIHPGAHAPPGHSALRTPHSALPQHWLRLGYVFIFALFLFRLFYLSSGVIELSEDEAYQWTWSKHLALSYYSKPPFIAYTQFLGTHLWGDTELGVRFFSPVIAAILSFLLLRFFAREVSAKAGLVLVLMLSAAPLPAVGSLLMTIDPLSVLFWTAAMLAGWRAVQENGTTANWLWAGLWMGCGFLSKYTNLFQLFCWLIFFALWSPARRHLRRPGPYLALLILALSLTPVVIWNSQHQWITLDHVATNGALHKDWTPTSRYAIDFVLNEAVLLNPIFFVAFLCVAFRRKNFAKPLPAFLFSMGAPLFLFFFAYSFHSRILPNWIAPSIVPLFALTVVYFFHEWPKWRRVLQPLLVVGLAGGFFLIAVLHQTDLTGKFFKRTLPVRADPLTRVRGWKETARLAETARQNLATEGKPTFIIGDHYGIVGEMSFYSVAAREKIRGEPLVYFRSSTHPRNQFYFWPGYETRVGQNAVYVQQIDLPDLPKTWWIGWLKGKKFLPGAWEPEPPPPQIVKQFSSVTDLGVFDVLHEKRLVRRVQIFACHSLLKVGQASSLPSPTKPAPQ